ncbi:serine/threonine-protein kinase [Pseudonocardia bannensis]|uniref:non-specific serine/threonine protein kinase n=1 Tax=Pseudonocardia bannensis TaxID=630973 RepID=A0A848DK37_9PSEU|nr:serine/threonine-protein kinase [Pseudonocardia bannensis]NMH92925.1 protein kinase [Pseudonocardia bannensis]
MTGTTFGPYTIEGLLGRGGMGEVYRAYDTETDRVVALKLLPGHLASNEEYLERFRRECRAAARLREPHVVPIHRFGEIDGRLYLDMRLVEGTDLGAWLRAYGPLPPAAAVAVVAQVASALDAAHADGLVHRDVKPSNVLLSGIEGCDVDPGSLFAYLFDFGIARSRDTDDSSDALTRTGTMPGSLAYIAPERFTGAEADRRVDVYALACVLHQALTGHQPFDGDLPTLLHAHLHAPPPRPSEVWPGVPPALDAVVARGMAKDPDQRFPTAGTLAAAARGALGAPFTTAPGPPSDPGTDPRPSLLGTGTPGPGGSDPRASGNGYGYGPPGHGAGGYGGPAGTGAPGSGSDPRQPIDPGGFSGPNHLVPGHPGTTATGRPGSRAAWIGIGVAAAVVVAGVVVIIAVLRGGGTGTAIGPDATTAPASPPTSAATPTGATPDAATQLLLNQLPNGFGASNCTPDASLGGQPGATAYVVCNSGPVGGPSSATFTRYATRTQMDESFEQAAAGEGIPTALGKVEDCRGGANLRASYVRGEVEGGSVGCFTEASSGAAFLFWTDNAALAFGYVRGEDGDRAKLYDWWQSTDFVTQR